MKHRFFKCVFLIVLITTPSAVWAEFHLATGLGGLWTIRKDYGEDPYFRFGGELPLYAYIPIAKPLWLRSGLRLGYTDDQPEMPSAVKIRERDFSYAFEAAAVWDWYLMPSLGFGYGVINRRIDLKTSHKLDVEDDKISGSETLSFWQSQLGLGIPILEGLIVMEPFLRYWNIKSDNRSNWSFGFDLTVQIL